MPQSLMVAKSGGLQKRSRKEQVYLILPHAHSYNQQFVSQSQDLLVRFLCCEVVQLLPKPIYSEGCGTRVLAV